MLTRASLAGAALSLAALIAAGGTNITDASAIQEGKKESSLWDGPSRIGAWKITPRSTKDHPLNEDEWGWNCFTDGNGECGTHLMRKARGFITPDQSSAMPDDRCITYSDFPNYVMCADGRSYRRVPRSS